MTRTATNLAGSDGGIAQVVHFIPLLPGLDRVTRRVEEFLHFGLRYPQTWVHLQMHYRPVLAQRFRGSPQNLQFRALAIDLHQIRSRQVQIVQTICPYPDLFKTPRMLGVGQERPGLRNAVVQKTENRRSIRERHIPSRDIRPAV